MAKRRIRSKRHSDRRRSARRKRIIFYATAAFVLVVMFVGLTHLSSLQINDVVVNTEANHLEQQQIEQEAAATFQERALLLVRRDNLLLLPRSELRTKIARINRRIKSVEIDAAGLQQININIKNRQPVGEACVEAVPAASSSPVATTSSRCKLIDETSYLFANAASSSEQLIFTTQEEYSLGSRLLPTEQFETLLAFLQKLPEIGLQPRRVRLSQGKYFDITVQAVDSRVGDPEVELQLVDDNLQQGFENLQTAIEQNLFESVADAGGRQESVPAVSLEYINLHTENKVFYR